MVALLIIPKAGLPSTRVIFASHSEPIEQSQIGGTSEPLGRIVTASALKIRPYEPIFHHSR